MACSEKQRLANQLNAQKSTGPVTEEGKRKSRGNAVKHGFCSEVLALDAETPELIEEERQLWLDDLAPSGHVAERMVERAFRAYLRLDRCDRARDARLAARQERASREWALGLIAERDRGIQMLTTHCTAAITLLRSIPQGCEWLADFWADLQREFETDVADEDHYTRILDLLGKQGSHHWRVKNQVLLYHAMIQDKQNMKTQGVPAGADEAYLRANLHGAYVDRVLANRRRGEEARTYLIDCCRSQVEALQARDRSLQPQFLAERDQARAAALFDDSPEAARLHRYASDADREMHRNVKAARSARDADSTELSMDKEITSPTTDSSDPTPTSSRNEAISAIDPHPAAPRNEAISITAPSEPTPTPSTSNSRNEPISTVQAPPAERSDARSNSRNEAISAIPLPESGRLPAPNGSQNEPISPIQPPPSGSQTAESTPTSSDASMHAHRPNRREFEPTLAIMGLLPPELPASPLDTPTNPIPPSPPIPFRENPLAIPISTLARFKANRAIRESQ